MLHSKTKGLKPTRTERTQKESNSNKVLEDIKEMNE